jgi:hypothetical protein
MKPFFLVADALLFVEKFRQRAALYFGLDCGMLEYSSHEP